MPSVRELLKGIKPSSNVNNNTEALTTIKSSTIPERNLTEFASITKEQYLTEKLQPVINFDPNLSVVQSCQIEGVDPAYATNVNIGQQLVHIIKRDTNQHVTDIPFVQLYAELLNSDADLDYADFEASRQKAYEEKYVAPTVDVIKSATKPSIFSLPKKEETSYTPTIEDLPSNMQPQAQDTKDEGEIDQMPTQVLKRGRKPKAVVEAPPQKETDAPKATNALLQDIASSNNGTSVVEQLKLLGNAIPSDKLPISTNKQDNGVVDVKDISFDKFRPSTQFVEAISTIVTELSRYFNQTK